ncbi:MAG TPA: hypothetical protein VEM15_15280 [Thermodesulfobacteriota bacterium]|nr:hypothetical protein [Thermodesulfobacteriota bacterium]
MDKNNPEIIPANLSDYSFQIGSLPVGRGVGSETLGERAFVDAREGTCGDVFSKRKLG